jgi:hypothetical protein
MGIRSDKTTMAYLRAGTRRRIPPLLQYVKDFGMQRVG